MPFPSRILHYLHRTESELVPDFTLLPGVLVPTLQCLVVEGLGTCSKRIASLQ